MTAEQHLTYCESLWGRRATWDSYAQRILEWCTPHRAFITQKTGPGMPPVSLGNISRIHDTTAIDSSNTLADSHMSSLVPLGSVWFKYFAPTKYQGKDGSEEIVTWYEKRSNKDLERLTRSNFYNEIYSVFRDRSTVGTGAMFIEKGQEEVFNFKYMPFGSYAVAENQEGNIRTLYRKFDLTCTEAVDKFMPKEGDEQPTVAAIKAKLGDAIGDCYDAAMKGDATKMSEKFVFVHGVQPRLKRNPKVLGAQDMKYESVYIVEKDKTLVEEGGFDTFPFLVTRFEKWGTEPYGYSPAYNAMPNILTANYLKKLLKAIGEVKALPRLFVMATSKRQVDMRAGGQTVVSKEEAAAGLPRQWVDNGDFELGWTLLLEEQASIRRFFFTDLFKMFSSMPPQVLKDMTAEVAKGLKSENLLLLAPSFTQFTTDFRPVMERLFAISLEYDDDPAAIPEELLADNIIEAGTAEVPDPSIAYISRFGLALKELEDQAADGVIRAAGEVAATFYPAIMDNFDLDEWIKQKAQTAGMNSDILREAQKIVAMRDQRAEQARAAQEAAMAQSVATTAKDASQAKPEVLQQLAAVA